MTNSGSKRLAYFLYSLLVIAICVFIYFAFTLSQEHANDAGKVALGCSYRTVTHVVDGDTFDIKDGTRIRMIGIDSPESEDTRKPVQFFAKKAKKELASLIAGKTVKLCKGGNDTLDKYDRALRYVWVGNTLVNAFMVKNGYAKAYTVFPFEYKEQFLQYQQKAKAGGLGLWNKEAEQAFEKSQEKAETREATCGTNTVCPKDASHFYGQTKTVRMYVARSYDSGKAVFLDSQPNYEDPGNFTVVIFASNLSKFPHNPAVFYSNKTIDVTGKIQEYQNTPEIVVNAPSQIKLTK